MRGFLAAQRKEQEKAEQAKLTQPTRKHSTRVFVKPRKATTKEMLFQSAVQGLQNREYFAAKDQALSLALSNMSGEIFQDISQGMSIEDAIQKKRNNINASPIGRGIWANPVRAVQNIVLDKISEYNQYASNREYDPWLREQVGGPGHMLVPANSTDTASKISEIFAWADQKGMNLGRAATWYDEPIQFNDFKKERGEIKQLISKRVRNTKAGTYFNNRLNEILEDTAEADREILRAKYPRYEGLNTFFNDLKNSYEKSKIRDLELSNLRYEILDKYPKVEFTQPIEPPEPRRRHHRHRSEESTVSYVDMSTSPDLGEHQHRHRQRSQQASMNTAKKAVMEQKFSNRNEPVHVPKQNNSEKARDLSALSQSTISTPARTDSEVVKRSVDKSRRPVVYGNNKPILSESSALSSTEKEQLKVPVTTKFTSSGSVIQSAPSAKPHKEVADQVKQKKEKPFESAIFSGGITQKPKKETVTKPISQKPPAKGFDKISSESTRTSENSGKYSAERKLHPTVKKGDSQAQFQSYSDTASVASFESTGSRLRGASLMDVESGSMASDSASIASVDGKIVRKEKVVNTKPPAKKFQPMLSEGSSSYEVAAKEEKKPKLRRSRPSTFEYESEPEQKLGLLSESFSSSYEVKEQPKPTTRLANSNVQSTEVSRKTPVSRRIRGNEEVIVDGANVKQLRRQIYGLYRTNNPSQYGGGMVGRPSANPLFGVLRRRNSNDLW